MSDMANKTCLTLSAIPFAKERCSKIGRKFLLDGNPVLNFHTLLTRICAEDPNEILRHLYIDCEMSSTDICNLFMERLGVCASQRMLIELFVRAGVPTRNSAERKALSWKQGKMDASVAKTRQGLAKAYAIGSKLEHKVRFLLREAMITLAPSWEIIIGDHFQYTGLRYEIDIPFVAIDNVTGKCVKIAIEIDSRYTHGTPQKKERDDRKDLALSQQGWRVLRISTDKTATKEWLADTVGNLACEIHEAILNDLAKT